MLIRFAITLAMLPTLFSFGQTSFAQTPISQTDHAVILAYHHVSDDTPASTSITPADFAAQLEFIAANGYIVWPLGQLVSALRHQEPVPNNVVALTFDDAYETVFTQARPLLQSHGWPYTVFVNTDAIDRAQAPYMDWQQLKVLTDEGVEIGNHSASHAHLLTRMKGEKDAQWRLRIVNDTHKAQNRIVEKLGIEPELFAYPYGEYDAALSSLITSFGFTGFGQQSGPIGVHSDFTGLPRFPISGSYTSLADLNTRLKSRPLRVLADPPGPMVLPHGSTPPPLTLTIEEGPYDLEQLACFASGDGKMLKRRTEISNMFVVQTKKPLQTQRTKYNCTAPSTDPNEAGVFYWWSYLIITSF